MSFFDKIIEWGIKVREFGGDYLAPALPIIKFFSVLFSLFFAFAIVYSLAKSQWLTSKIDDWSEALKVANLYKRRSVRSWRGILKKLHSRDPGDWKKAIVDSDKALGELLNISGYRGETTYDRLLLVTEEILPNVEILREAHLLRKKIEKDPSLSLTHEDALSVVRNYAAAFRELGLID